MSISLQKKGTHFIKPLLFLLACTNCLFAANQDHSGFGIAVVPNIGFVAPGLAAGVDLNIYNLFLVNHKIRIATSEEIFGIPDSSNAHIEVGYLIGIWKRKSFGYVSVMTGISRVETTKKGKEITSPNCFLISCTGGTYEISKSETIGLPFQLDAVLVKHLLGIGISITGNINIDKSYGGLIVQVPIGWVP